VLGKACRREEAQDVVPSVAAANPNVAMRILRTDFVDSIAASLIYSFLRT
jgi:hypothetical protein